MLKRVLADRRQVEDGEASSAAAPDGETAYPVAPDLGERRLGWFVAAIAVAAVMVLATTLTRLPGLRGSPDPSALQGAPAASWAGGDVASAGAATPPPAAGTPTGSVAALPAGGPGNPVATPGAPGGPAAARATNGVAALPGPGTTATLGTAGPGTTAPAGTDGPGATAEPVPRTDPPPDVKAAIADLSAAIRQQVYAGRLDPIAGDDLQSKVRQVWREVSEGEWGAARYVAYRIREKLRKYRDDGSLTFTGYQALISRLAALDEALS